MSSAVSTSVDHQAASSNLSKTKSATMTQVAVDPPSGTLTAVIRDVTPTVTTFSYPFSRVGIIPFGGRSVAIKLNDGTVWLMASTPLDPPTKAKIDTMGQVAFIVAPDIVHHLFLPQYASAYPAAKVIGVVGHEQKRKDVEFDGLYGRDAESTAYGFESEIQAKYFATFTNRDVVFHHKETKSLITADLILNLPAHEQYRNTPKGKPTSPIPLMVWLTSYLTPFSWLSQSLLGVAGVASPIPGVENGGSTADRRKRFAQDASQVAKWDFDRIIMCHGDVIETGGQKAWRAAFSKFIDADGNVKV